MKSCQVTTFSSSAYSNLKKDLKCIRSFTESCLRGMQKQTAALLGKGVNNNFKNLCNNPVGRKKAVRASRCISKFRHDFRVISEDFSNDFRYANGQSDIKEKMVSMCCAYHKFSKRLNDKSSSLCHPVEAENLRRFVETISGDIMSLLCSSYSPELPQCIAFASRVTHGNFSLQDQTSSFVPPLLVLVENF